MGLKALLLGEGDRYRYGPMCMPTVPWKKSDVKLNFYDKGMYAFIMLATTIGLLLSFLLNVT